MTTMRMRFTIILTVAALLTAIVTRAQGDKASRPSPPATATGNVNGATVTVNYGSPAVKGRQIFGGLVPYDKAWRAGANEATIVEVSKDVKVEGKPLPAGKYSLFAVPGEKEWTVILNSETGQWGVKRTGEANRDPAKDVVTVQVKPKKAASPSERLTYAVTAKGIVLDWDTVEVPIAVK